MTQALQQSLLDRAMELIPDIDPSHDMAHTLRVVNNAMRIADEEGADKDIVFAAALFHDVITYAKNDPRSAQAQDESAALAGGLLTEYDDFPQQKIPAVMEAIVVCSFTKGIVPDDLESRVLQDADGLEATGTIGIMRTFASTGYMGRPFYDPDDPFAESRPLDAKSYALDLFYERLLKVAERMHTTSGRRLAEEREVIVRQFLKEFAKELAYQHR